MKKTYNIQGLDCVHCAMEVEEYLNKDENICACTCDYAMCKLEVTYKNKEYSMEELDKKIKQVESEATILTHKKQKRFNKFLFSISQILLSIMLFVPCLFLTNQTAKLVLLSACYVASGFLVVYTAIKSVFVKKNPFDENMLMTVATIGAFCIGEYLEACLVMILFDIGQILEQVAVSRTRQQILNTLDKRPKMANKIVDGKVVSVHATDLEKGDTIVLKAGEILSVDGIVTKGSGLLDTSSVNGEFTPTQIGKDYQIKSGCKLLDGFVEILVENTFGDSFASKILQLVTQSKQTKSKTDRFITKFSKVYTPVVFGLAILTFLIPSIITNQWITYLYRALSFLVISCPCAVVISVPLVFFTGLGLSAKNGILIKGANVLENLYSIGAVVCDKTGTLTYGKFEIKDVKTFVDENQFKTIFASIESYSLHPIAKCICENWKQQIFENKVEDFHQIEGGGISAKFGGTKYFVGNKKILEPLNLSLNTDQNAIFLASEKQVLGYVVVDDKLKEGCFELFEYLGKNNIQTYLLSGDKSENGQRQLEGLKFDKCYYELLPLQKQEYLSQICQNKKTIFMGDGINDAPALAKADIGISMGSLGNDLAVEASDVVIVSDHVEKVKTAIKIAKKTRFRAWFNIAFALAVKITFLILSGLGITDMFWAVLADVGLTVLLIINSVMLIFSKIEK